MRYRSLFLLALAAGCAEDVGDDDASQAEAISTSAVATRAIAVDQSSAKVLVFDVAATDWSKDSAVVWSWGPSDSREIASSHRAWFSNLSDVKYDKTGKYVLVAASGGGVAKIRVADKAVMFYARPNGNTHSVELLPDGNLVSASSTGGYLDVLVTDPKASPSASKVRSKSYAFPDAHGVYWDATRKLLYAAGGSAVKAFAYEGTPTSPSLREVKSWKLPSGQAGAHDLFPIPSSNLLYVTNTSHVFELDRDTGLFQAYSGGPDHAHVKAVGRNPGSPEVMWLTPTESWWSDTIRFDAPAGTRTRKGARFYKARWVAPTP